MYDPFAYDRLRLEQSHRERRIAAPRLRRREARASRQVAVAEVHESRRAATPCFD